MIYVLPLPLRKEGNAQLLRSMALMDLHVASALLHLLDVY